MDLAVDMSKTSRLRFDALKERSDEVRQPSQATGRKIVFLDEMASGRFKLEITQPSMAHSV